MKLVAMVMAAGFAVAGCKDARKDAQSQHTSPWSAAAPGRIEGADRTVLIAFPFPQRIEAVAVRQGDSVTKGQVLARLDCTELAQEERALRGEARALTLAVTQLATGVRREELAQARARQTGAEAVLAQAKAQEVRQAELNSKGMISSAALDEARKSSAVAETGLSAASAALELMIAGPRKIEINIASARAEAARAKADAINARLVKCEVKAPMDGTIVRLNARLGETADQSADGVAQLADLRAMHVRAEIDELDVGRVRVGMTATARTESGIEANAVVVAVAPVMGRKTVKGLDPAEKTDREVREVLLRLTSPVSLPIGYRVTVAFEADLPAK